MLEREGKKHASVSLLRISCNAQWLQSLYKVCATQCSTISHSITSHMRIHLFSKSWFLAFKRNWPLLCDKWCVSLLEDAHLGCYEGEVHCEVHYSGKEPGVSHLFGLLPCLLLLGKELEVQLLLLLLVVLLQLDRVKKRMILIWQKCNTILQKNIIIIIINERIN